MTGPQGCLNTVCVGRLHERCLQILAGADISFRRHNRLDVCLVKNHHMALSVSQLLFYQLASAILTPITASSFQLQTFHRSSARETSTWALPVMMLSSNHNRNPMSKRYCALGSGNALSKSKFPNMALSRQLRIFPGSESSQASNFSAVNSLIRWTIGSRVTRRPRSSMLAGAWRLHVP